MKTKNWFLSVAMFAIAIVGAFALSSVQTDFHYRIDEDDENSCTDISVQCQGGTVQCFVVAPEGIRRVWQDLDCLEQMTHSNTTPLPEL